MTHPIRITWFQTYSNQLNYIYIKFILRVVPSTSTSTSTSANSITHAINVAHQELAAHMQCRFRSILSSSQMQEHCYVKVHTQALGEGIQKCGKIGGGLQRKYSFLSGSKLSRRRLKRAFATILMKGSSESLELSNRCWWWWGIFPLDLCKLGALVASIAFWKLWFWWWLAVGRRRYCEWLGGVSGSDDEVDWIGLYLTWSPHSFLHRVHPFPTFASLIMLFSITSMSVRGISPQTWCCF
jgi:hypothetical protein